jgi:hypothetical protein
MNGKELLDRLNNLSIEELNLPVILDGCDCEDDLGEVKVYFNRVPLDQIFLIRKDHV